VFVSQQRMTASGAAFEAEAGPLQYAHLQHYTAAYREWGEGPPLVLVHGLGGGMGLLAPLAAALGRRFRVITFQLRGEDDCFALRRRFGIHDLVEDVAEFLDYCRLERPLMAGVSFGGALALEFAARYPHRPAALAVQGCGAYFERGLVQKIAGLVLARYPLPEDSPFVNQFYNLLFGRRQTPGPLFDFVVRQCWQTDQGVMAHRFRLAQRLDLRPRLGRVQAPVLVAAPGRDPLISRASLDQLCGGLPDARRFDMPRCGHLAFITDPAVLGGEMTRFFVDKA
jgi:pimeloyl-ACP methyl ester carboxylesterase